MKEHPILMSAFSVNAILDDRKGVTRRIATDDPSTKSIRWVENADTTPKGNYTGWVKECGAPLLIPIKCRYGIAGDRLWIRETFCTFPESAPDGMGQNLYFKADQRRLEEVKKIMAQNGVKWRPSIFMPRWASRLLLEVKDVRAERVQEITPEDAIREGYPFDAPKSKDRNTYIDWFHGVWNAMHSKPKPAYARDDGGQRVIEHYVSYPWEDVQETRTHRGKPWHVVGNPWVWAIAFRRSG